MRFKIKFHHLLLMGALALGSCQKEYVKPAPIPPPPSSVSFAADIVPFFTAKCVTGCHESGGAFDGLRLTSSEAYAQLWTAGTSAPYVDTVNVSSSLLYTKIAAGGTMNDYAIITPEERAKVLKWIDDGAKNN